MRKCWRYSNKYSPPVPVIYLTIHTIDRKVVYPSIGSQEIFLDTGYDGYILIPWSIYDTRLSLDLYQAPIKVSIETPLGGKYNLHIARAFVKIQELDTLILTYVESYRENTEFFAGRGFINMLKLLLNGPSTELCIETSEE